MKNFWQIVPKILSGEQEIRPEEMLTVLPGRLLQGPHLLKRNSAMRPEPLLCPRNKLSKLPTDETRIFDTEKITTAKRRMEIIQYLFSMTNELSLMNLALLPQIIQCFAKFTAHIRRRILIFKHINWFRVMKMCLPTQLCRQSDFWPEVNACIGTTFTLAPWHLFMFRKTKSSKGPKFVSLMVYAGFR
jgi:hypothetical protein